MSSDRGVSWEFDFTTTIVSLIHHGNANIDAFQWSATFSSHKKRKWVFKFNWCEVLFDFFPPSQSAAVKCVNHQSWQMREAKCQMDTHTVKVLLVGVLFCVLLFCFSISPHFRPPSGPLTSSITGMWRHDMTHLSDDKSDSTHFTPWPLLSLRAFIKKKSIPASS